MVPSRYLIFDLRGFMTLSFIQCVDVGIPGVVSRKWHNQLNIIKISTSFVNPGVTTCTSSLGRKASVPEVFLGWLYLITIVFTPIWHDVTFFSGLQFIFLMGVS